MHHWPTLITILALAAAPAAFARIEIELRESVNAERVFYTLGDIAGVRADDPALGARVRGHRLGRSPRVGQIDGVTRSDVGAHLEGAFPGLQSEIEWRGPELVRVRGAGRSIDSEDYGDAAESFLHAWLAERFDDYRLERLDARRPMKVPLGELDIRPRLRNDERVSRRMAVWLNIYVDDVEVGALPVWFGVAAMADGFVAARPLEAGERLQADAVEPARIDVAATCRSPADESWLAGRHRLGESVQAGQALCAEALEPLPAVRRGQPLTVIAQAGKVTVSVVATALQDGEAGDVIDVRREEDGPRFAVRVTGERQAVTAGGDDD